MKFQSALLLGAAVLGAQAKIIADPAQATITAPAVLPRQNDGGGDTGGDAGGDAGGDNESSDSSSSDESSASSSGSDPSETSSSSDDTGDNSTTDGGDEDSTVFRTETVTDGNADTITRKTTKTNTSTFTVVVISTVFDTTTVTSRDQDTATKTVYETSTVIKKDKRDYDFAPRTIDLPQVDAVPTQEAAPTVSGADWDRLEMARYRMQRDNVLNKRATVTEVETVTVGDDSETTVLNTVTREVIVTRSTVRTTTKMVTETEQADAKTTKTVTSTLTVTSTGVSTGQTSVRTSGGDGEASKNGSKDSTEDSGLSTGAKVGIGIGAGVGALAIIGALIFFCLRRRRRNSKHDDDIFGGSSEVPVGAPVSSSTPMSHEAATHHAAAAGLLSPHGRAAPAKTSPEGYRGTAMGDGRAGYAKPEPYGAAYTQPSSTSPTNRSSTLNSSNAFSPHTQTMSSMGGADSLPSHPAPNDTTEMGYGAGAGRWQQPGATEMDAAGVGHTSSATPQNVYEMPSGNYR